MQNIILQLINALLANKVEIWHNLLSKTFESVCWDRIIIDSNFEHVRLCYVSLVKIFGRSLRIFKDLYEDLQRSLGGSSRIFPNSYVDL